jgi:hypothetical protein
VRLALALSLLPLPAVANFVETTWLVTAFTGEAWQQDPEALIGQTQVIESGFASGVFYQCDYGGQSFSYDILKVEDFVANPVFADFFPLADDLRATNSPIYVHRISCAGGETPGARQAMFPFVTTDNHSTAYFQFEGVVYTLTNLGMAQTE